ncbi:hypothetical protein Cni_G05336 [Canna indica]|uniref:Uncharacterized protein n=1 Tax=Canna indica TaxID=4628 RepID=A0AAQ3JWU2_9LILI|nr:hypothetical protein Cni_G05336 [Canna indica]
MDSASQAGLAGVDVDADREDEDGGEGEEDDGVDEDGDAAGLQRAELHQLPLAGDLEQQPRRQQHEEHHRYEHRPPVRHMFSPLPRSLLQGLGERKGRWGGGERYGGWERKQQKGEKEQQHHHHHLNHRASLPALGRCAQDDDSRRGGF